MGNGFTVLPGKLIGFTIGLLTVLPKFLISYDDLLIGERIDPHGLICHITTSDLLQCMLKSSKLRKKHGKKEPCRDSLQNISPNLINLAPFFPQVITMIPLKIQKKLMLIAAYLDLRINKGRQDDPWKFKQLSFSDGALWIEFWTPNDGEPEYGPDHRFTAYFEIFLSDLKLDPEIFANKLYEEQF